MVSFADYERAFTTPPQPGDADPVAPAEAGSGLLRTALLLVGAGLVLAAFGVWVLPSGAADPAMMLIRLVFSLGLFGGGMLCIHAGRMPDTRPEVQIDGRRGEIRVIHGKTASAPAHSVVHRIDDLKELSLRDGLFSARDGAGRLIVSLELVDARTEADLRKALSLAV
ncbi:hypothetical protein [Roseovarius autotrophicus]|uniref:hypothetical protein n=1 Tax=Roseovarius autotrophicus TaxID=2824121 RepID=UPI0019EA1D6D|nr:hypothetical protein [Roseovarius autotrophicus]MBE0452101.1 hypothetical protein [Roseovarius sp.]